MIATLEKLRMARLAPDEKEVEEFIQTLEAVRPTLPSALIVLLGEFERQTHLWDVDVTDLLDFFENNDSISFKQYDLPVELISSLGVEVSRSIDSLSSNYANVVRSCFMVSIPKNLSLSLVNEQLGAVFEAQQNVEGGACCVFEKQAEGPKMSYFVMVSHTV